jgi:glycosyltransferase involved in cell wall biosynthesis
MIRNRSTVFVHAWTGNADKGRNFAQARYTGAEIVALSHRELRQSGWRGQIRAFARLRGKAIVFYFRALSDVRELELLTWVHLLHGCGETVLADEEGNVKIITLKHCVRQFPQLLAGAIADAAVFALSWLRFRRLRHVIRQPVPPSARLLSGPLSTLRGELDLCYLYPYPLTRDFSGGAITHFRGVVDGMAENGASCEVFSGARIPFALPCPVRQVPPRRKRFLFPESLMLSYNWEFARQTQRLLNGRLPRAIYQRHGRFVIAGALLARALRVPLVLEYNGSEVWFADHWDPARFAPWLRMGEEIALWAASRIVVVSEALKAELIARGLPEERILVNPNGVDPAKFDPRRSGDRVRREFGFEPHHVVAAFLGTFSYWHGVEVLEKAIRKLSSRTSDTVADKLRFLLIGDGPLHHEMRAALREFEEQGRVIFAGRIPHDEAPAYLNAADVLLSPHVPMPDGRPFIGSPTKLFEYMAMGKTIVASRLDQLEKILRHNETALLVEPGNVEELAAAIRLAASSPELRDRLGRNARLDAVTKHTWKINAARVLHATGFLSANGSVCAEPAAARRSQPLPIVELG